MTGLKTFKSCTLVKLPSMYVCINYIQCDLIQIPQLFHSP